MRENGQERADLDNGKGMGRLTRVRVGAKQIHDDSVTRAEQNKYRESSSYLVPEIVSSNDTEINGECKNKKLRHINLQKSPILYPFCD